MKLILGSSSPYRQQLLREMGLEFQVMSPDIDERAITVATPWERAMALACEKGDALLDRWEASLIGDPVEAEPALIITADQVVAHAGTIREKPRDAEEARHFLRTAGEAPPETISAIAVTHSPSGIRASGVDVVRIHLLPLPEPLIEELIADGEIFHCAGGMRIEDPRVAPYILAIEGELDSVMGLPKRLTRSLLDEVTGKVHDTDDHGLVIGDGP